MRGRFCWSAGRRCAGLPRTLTACGHADSPRNAIPSALHSPNAIIFSKFSACKASCFIIFSSRISQCFLVAPHLPCALQATSAKHFTRLATQLARASGSLARSRATMACCCVLAQRALKCELQGSVAQGQPADHKHEKHGFATAKHGALRSLWNVFACIHQASSFGLDGLCKPGLQNTASCDGFCKQGLPYIPFCYNTAC